MDRFRPQLVAAIVVALAASARAAPAPPAGWRATLANAVHLGDLTHTGFEFPDGFHRMDAERARVDAELVAAIARLPNDSADLPEAVCELAARGPDRGALEAELLRAIAVARTQAAGSIDRLFGSLRTTYLSVQLSQQVRGGKLVAEDGAAIAGGAASYSCAAPDVGHLEYLLVELYADEEHYPTDPFAGTPYPGTPTTRHGVHGHGVKVLDTLYKEITATAGTDAALASVLELATIYCEPSSHESVCGGHLVDRALAIREHALPADDPSLADVRVMQARALLAKKRTREAELAFRKVLAEARPGATARLHAAIDLAMLLRGRGELPAARALEASLIADLSRPAADTWAWSALAEVGAELARSEGRSSDGAHILAAAVTGLAAPDPRCRIDACDHRGFQLELLDAEAALDHPHAAAITAQAAVLHRELDAIHAQQVTTVRAILANIP